MKKILLTAGAIPAKLDSVKYLGNKFKGGLAIKAAQYLQKNNFDVTVLASKQSNIKEKDYPELKFTFIDDVFEYYNYIKNSNGFDSFILSAAVANLAPSNPYKGKFPSHNYKVGDKINVEFEIAPRIIDDIKKQFPRSDLIGYKLYDGTEQELIAAAKKTLFESLSNIVFANNPNTAAHKKICLTQDGAVFDVSFDEHLELIKKLLVSKFYSTKTFEIDLPLNENDKWIFDNYQTYESDGRKYGTVAIRKENNQFITTTRGKKTSVSDYSAVISCSHESREIVASKKATLNAPLLDKFFKENPSINILYHGHELIGKVIHNEYEFAGSDRELIFTSKKLIPFQPILLPNHGFIVGFETFEQFVIYLTQQKLK